MGVMSLEMVEKRLSSFRAFCTKSGGTVPRSVCDGAAWAECAYVLVGVDASEYPLV
jgi:hypothetical protein